MICYCVSIIRYAFIFSCIGCVSCTLCNRIVPSIENIGVCVVCFFGRCVRLNHLISIMVRFSRENRSVPILKCYCVINIFSCVCCCVSRIFYTINNLLIPTIKSVCVYFIFSSSRGSRLSYYITIMISFG